MYLSDKDIAEQLDSTAPQSLTIEPITDFNQQIQPSSIDLRLGQEFIVPEQRGVRCIHPLEDDPSDYMTHVRVGEDEPFILHPGDFALATTYERVEIPPKLIGFLMGRSSIGRLGILVHHTAGLIDPGYRGQITLELTNLGWAPVALPPGIRISQLTLAEMQSEADRPYGTERNSKYQEQEGPLAAKTHHEDDTKTALE